MFCAVNIDKYGVYDEVFGICQMIFVESDEIDHTKF